LRLHSHFDIQAYQIDANCAVYWRAGSLEIGCIPGLRATAKLELNSYRQSIEIYALVEELPKITAD
jgi:hypothetical protein